MGQNYFRSLFAVGFQGLLILVCVAIYAVLIQSIATDGDPIGAIWGCVGYTHLFQLCLIGLQNSGIELFPELLCDRVGHIPVAAFAVRLTGHPKKEALAALPSGRSGAVWDIRCCCVLPYSKQAVLQNPSSAAIR